MRDNEAFSSIAHPVDRNIYFFCDRAFLSFRDFLLCFFLCRTNVTNIIERKEDFAHCLLAICFSIRSRKGSESNENKGKTGLKQD